MVETDVSFAASTQSVAPLQPRGDESSPPRQGPPPSTGSSVDDILPSQFVGEVVQKLHDRIERESPSRSSARAEREPCPEQIGNYDVRGLLGRGAFGDVYRAENLKLERTVAIKILKRTTNLRGKRRRLSDEEYQKRADEFRHEASALARLKHPHIVTVHDIGELPDGRWYIVSEFIDGGNLAERIASNRPSPREAATIAATVADALHYAHTQLLIHRDIKPANILLDAKGVPHLADFGLALGDDDYGNLSATQGGTPAYMSPEQARREGHLVDNRSDVFSLGVVLYELLTGKRPFVGKDVSEVVQRITTLDPRPPRMLDDAIPKELERICLKALEKRKTDRYTTAKDMAEDLRQAFAERSVAPAAESQATASTRDAPPPGGPAKVVPKGMRSFDEGDADFFLELLPGPRDRDGLPESIRFWKTRIEATDADNSLRVGVLIGPSGCGKSSLLKAGLLPRLADHVRVLFLETSGDGTEAALLRKLHKASSGNPGGLGLVEIMAAMRRGQSALGTKKICIVLDQFEQWLNGQGRCGVTELAQALRHCDGERLQAVLSVRDDYYMAASRFMQELEIPLLPGHNQMAMDLFGPHHARKILATFGGAYGRLPSDPDEITHQQTTFLDRAVAGLLQDDLVIPVQLALFADMLKEKEWAPGTLKGGFEQIGKSFLEETFGEKASAQYRPHSKAAQAVLKKLLPVGDANIKGARQSRETLLAASGYAERPRDFPILMRILDSETRLITPAEDENRPVSDSDTAAEQSSQNHYQLTHDYLVSPLRSWLNQKQGATMRGRAEIRLRRRSEAWNAVPENRHLPSSWEYANIRLLTSKRDWTKPQRKMMGRAARVQSVRWGAALVVLFAIGIVVQQIVASASLRNLTRNVRTAVSNLSNVRGTAIPYAIEALNEFPPEMVKRELQQQFESAEDSQKLSLAYALASVNDVRCQLLVDSIAFVQQPADCPNIISALSSNREEGLALIDQAVGEATAAEDWQVKARLAIVALHLGEPKHAADMLAIENRPDPIQRTVFIGVFPRWHGDLTRLADVVRETQIEALRSGICLAVGSVWDDDINSDVKSVWREVLENWYSRLPDAPTHSAAGWALRRWGITPVDEPSASPMDAISEETRGQILTHEAEVQEIEQRLAERRQAWEADLRSTEEATVDWPQDGLVAHYPLEEPPGESRDAADETSPAAAILGSGKPTEVVGVVGGGLRFNKDAKLVVESGVKLGENGAFSCACWFLVDDRNGIAMISNEDPQNGYRGIEIGVYIGELEVLICGGRDGVAGWSTNRLKVTADLPEVFPDRFVEGPRSIWQHVLVTYDGGGQADGVKVYLNGRSQPVSVREDGLDAAKLSEAPLYIGGRTPGSVDWFEGQMDEVRIYDRELNESEVQQLFSADVMSFAKIPDEDRSAQQRYLLAQAYESTDDASIALRQQLNSAAERLIQVQREAATSLWTDSSPKWFVNSAGMTMIAVPAGSFVRRSGDAIPGIERRYGIGVSGPIASDDSSVDQKVTLSRAFLLADREVTQAQFQQFIDDAEYPDAEKPKIDPETNPSIASSSQTVRQDDSATTALQPIEQVGWAGSVMFCNWLSRQEGLRVAYERTGEHAWRLVPAANGYRLPTEAEWEHACRAGTTTTFSHGDLGSLANYAALNSRGVVPGRALPGSNKPNGWGLFDLHGGAWEWSHDWYGPYEDVDNVTDPIGPAQALYRVIRSGRTSDSRYYASPMSPFQLVGFRVARSYP